jgi:hypothetical protein
VLDLNPKTQKRAEQSVNTYYRLFKEELQPQIEADFVKQGGGMTQAAHRNKFLAEKLRNAPDEVRQMVIENKRKPEERTLQQVSFVDADDITDEEFLRRQTALKLSESVCI